PAPASREAGQVLSTTTPAGIAALDPEARRVDREPTDRDPREPFRFSTTLATLARNRFNPRERFDEAELQELAESLQKHGQLQPILVRAIPDGLRLKPLTGKNAAATDEIVAGERRALAAIRAGWSRVTVERIECDDARACELAIAENRDRRDISQVEYARGLQKLADLRGLDPASLAKDQRLSEQHVRNLLRLLKTPAEWQQLVIDGKLDGTHLRDAAPFLGHPKLADKLAKELARAKQKPSHDDWQRTVRRLAEAAGRKLIEYVHTSDCRKQGSVTIAPTHPRYADLEVVEVTGWNGQKEKIALNAKLADEILKEKAAEWRARNKPKRSPKAAPDTKQNRAKQKREAEEAGRRRTERLKGIVAFWKCWICSEAVAYQPGIAVRAILSAAIGGCELPARELLDEFGRERFRPKSAKYSRAADSGPLLALDEEEFEQLGLAAAQRLFWDACLLKEFHERWFHLDPYWMPEIDRWCKALQVDPAKAWRAPDAHGRQQFLGPLTEAWLDLHDRDQLAELAAEWKVPVLEKDSEAEIRRKLLGNAARLMPMPAELAGLLRSRGRDSGVGGQGKKKAKAK
ncbi:MAG TPA: ParB/RepB/Spo0J family partition protein, partial [Pirellulales bacterium]|nr:ParB/RepB/Spo0J family partition protein [Pirellulales bacterium]